MRSGGGRLFQPVGSWSVMRDCGMRSAGLEKALAMDDRSFVREVAAP